MKQRTVGVALIAFFVGLFIGVYGTFSYIENSFNSLETDVNDVAPLEEPDSFDGEYIVKLGMKELRLTEYDIPFNIGIIKSKGNIVSYDLNIQGVLKSGKSTYEIKNGSIFFDGVDIGLIVENPKIKGDFTVDFNNNFKEHYITLEKKL